MQAAFAAHENARSADFTERAQDVEFSRKRLSRTNGEGV